MCLTTSAAGAHSGCVWQLGGGRESQLQAAQTSEWIAGLTFNNKLTKFYSRCEKLSPLVWCIQILHILTVSLLSAMKAVELYCLHTLCVFSWSIHHLFWGLRFCEQTCITVFCVIGAESQMVFTQRVSVLHVASNRSDWMKLRGRCCVSQKVLWETSSPLLSSGWWSSWGRCAGPAESIQPAQIYQHQTFPAERPHSRASTCGAELPSTNQHWNTKRRRVKLKQPHKADSRPESTESHEVHRWGWRTVVVLLP